MAAFSLCCLIPERRSAQSNAAMELSDGPQGIVLSLVDGRRAVFDRGVPGVTLSAMNMLLALGHQQTVHVRWSRVPRRATLLHIYDSLALGSIAAYPDKRDALSGWTDMHATAVTTPGTSNAVRVVSHLGQLCVRDDTDAHVNHMYILCVRLALPADDLVRWHKEIATALYTRFVTEAAPPSGAWPPAVVQSYRFAGVLPRRPFARRRTVVCTGPPCCNGMAYTSTPPSRWSGS